MNLTQQGSGVGVGVGVFTYNHLLTSEPDTGGRGGNYHAEAQEGQHPANSQPVAVCTLLPEPRYAVLSLQ